jgi:DNA-binding response OmpR family regulator
MKRATRSYVVIEDDPDVTDLLVTILGEYDAGADVRTFDYLPPLDEIADPPPRAIVLDLTLGGQPVGLAFFEEIQTFAPLADVPILICTASPRDVGARASRTVADPRVEVILKPFSLDEFIAALRDLEGRAGLFAIPAASNSGKTPPAGMGAVD